MSDLAPLVEACIRDNIVADLMEENTELRRNCRKGQTVQIVAKHTGVVYAEGFLEDARMEEGSHSLKIGLTTKTHCPMMDLDKIYILVGGSRVGFLDCVGIPENKDGNLSHPAIDNQSLVTVTTTFHGYPYQDIHEGIRRRHAGRHADIDQLIIRVLQHLDPDITLTFDCVSLEWDGPKGGIEAFVPEPVRSRLVHQIDNANEQRGPNYRYRDFY